MSGPMEDDTNRRSGLFPSFGLGAELEADVQCAMTNSSPVLITAPSDVASMLASRIHRHGLNRRSPFLTVDCNRISLAEQLEVAFDAAGPRGTVFLRDVDRLSPSLQSFLCVKIVPLGVRVIAGTSVSLLRESILGTFEERLFYRLNQIHIVAPQSEEYSGAAC
jgi:DNA-binding NtrC family response regulator